MTKEEELKQKLEDKYNLPSYVINAITSTPFRVLKEVMNEEEYKCVLIPYFAKFYVSEFRKKKFKKMRDDKIRRKAERDNNRILESNMEEGSNREISREEIKDMQEVSNTN